MSDEKEPCNCGQTSWILNDPVSGFKINEQNRIVVETSEGAWYVVRHCIGCGGRLPDSSKPIWYPRLDTAEQERIEKLLEGVETAEQAIERFGPPGYDGWTVWRSDSGTVKIIEISGLNPLDQPGCDSEANESVQGRNFAYYNLSEVAEIEFYVESGIRTHTSVYIKNLPSRHIDEE